MRERPSINDVRISALGMARGRPFNGNPVKRCLTGRFNGNGNGRLTISDNGNTVKTANFRYKAFYKVMVLGFN